MSVPVHLEREPHLQYWPGIVANIDRHSVLRPVRAAPDRIPCHVGKRAGGFFLHGLDGVEFHALVVRGDLVALSHVEIERVIGGASPRLETRQLLNRS
jgi:hypothetical protein